MKKILLIFFTFCLMGIECFAENLLDCVNKVEVWLSQNYPADSLALRLGRRKLENIISSLGSEDDMIAAIKREFPNAFDASDGESDSGASDAGEEASAEVPVLDLTAAREGDSEAQYMAGEAYFRGAGVARNYDEAVKWYQASADQGNAKGMCALGICYLHGYGVQRDPDVAFRWMLQAVENSCIEAQYQIGLFYLNGWGCEKSDSEAVVWFQLAAEQNHPAAQYEYARSLELGRGVEKNNEEALSWYSRSAEPGYIPALSK